MYYDNGQLHVYQIFKNNSPKYLYSHDWYSNGKTESVYNNWGTGNDSLLEWDKDGKLSICKVIDKKGNFKSQAIYYNNGQLAEKTDWSNGLLLNVKTYDYHGEKLNIGTLKKSNGKYIQHEVTKDSLLKIKTIAEYKEGLIDGTFYFIGDNCDTIKNYSYKKGLKVGKYLKYKNNKRVCIGQFENDKKEGEFIYFNDNNEVIYKEQYKNNNLIKTTKLKNKITDKEKIEKISQFLLETKTINPDSLIQKFFWSTSIYYFYIYNHYPIAEIEQINDIKNRVSKYSFNILRYKDAVNISQFEKINLSPAISPDCPMYFSLDDVFVVNFPEDNWFYYFLMENDKIKSTMVFFLNGIKSNGLVEWYPLQWCEDWVYNSELNSKNAFRTIENIKKDSLKSRSLNTNYR